jgi:hypothetical protein
MKTKNLFNPTEGQIKRRNRLWAQALLKNKKKAICQMYENGGRCCLAVAQDVAIECGVDIPKNYDDDGMPHNLVAKFFGWDGGNPSLFFPRKDFISPQKTFTDRTHASELNDDNVYSQNGSHGVSHKKIAECVLNTFVHPSKKKWSFTI